MRFDIVSLLVGSAAAAFISPIPVVTIKNGTVVGSQSNGIDSFKGIPFAQPPVGPLRLKPPQSITKTYGVIQATATPSSCPQMLSSTNISGPGGPYLAALNANGNPFTTAALGPQSEDCLTLNVQRPSNVTSSKPLPVLFWIFGGGFELGSTAMYDGSNIIQKSFQLGGDFIYVATNYRVGGFGFLAGQELQNDGSTNLGLRDQRLALQWVQENIAAFGGDPNRVIIWGESAGSISVFDHLLINNGDNTYRGKPLFTGAIMDSGTAVPTLPVNSAKPQNVYNTVVSAANCSGSANTLACLRAAPYDVFYNAVNTLPGIFSYQSLDLSYLPRFDPKDNFFSNSPDVAASTGRFARVPVIVGDQEDEGTLFSFTISNVTDTDKLTTYLQAYFPNASRQLVAGLVNTYPTDPSAGSPFGTGPFNEIYPGFKRNAALLGDITFTITRRVALTYLKRYAPSLQAWSYLGSYFSGTPVLGTFHGTDVVQAYQGLPYAFVQNSILTYYISFVNTLNPNTYAARDSSLISWPEWQTANPQLLHFLQSSNGLIPDNFRQDTFNYLFANAANLKV